MYQFLLFMMGQFWEDVSFRIDFVEALYLILLLSFLLGGIALWCMIRQSLLILLIASVVHIICIIYSLAAHWSLRPRAPDV